MAPENLSLAISDLYACTITTGEITHRHQHVLREAIVALNLSEEERDAIDRVLRATIRGRFKLASS